MDRATLVSPTGTDVDGEIFPTALTLLKAMAVARWLTWFWMVGVVVVSGTRTVNDQAGDTSGPDTAFRHPLVAGMCVALVLTMAVIATLGIRFAPAQLMRPYFAIAEGLLALGLSAIDGWVFDPGHVFETSQSLATQYPLIAMASLGLAFGPYVASAVGVLLGPAEALAAVLNEFEGWSLRHTFSIIATSLFFAASGGLFGWLARLLQRVEGEIADRRARDEVRRVLHDTVLQTLALVENRTATTDPDLARAARDADRDLRRFLFGAASRERHTLESRIRSTVERVTEHHDIDVTVNVLDDGCAADPRQQNALAGAVGEAITNAIKHASAARIVVFVETDDVGQVFSSVRDDGIGFDPESISNGHGLSGSIRDRMADVGGRSEIHSIPGRGTEVRLWTN